LCYAPPTEEVSLDMPSDSPQHHAAFPSSRVVEIIERGQEDILRQLRDAGIPETEALAVIRRFNEFAVHVLRELDQLYRAFEALDAADPDRSQAHQEWFDTKLGGMLLTIEDFIAALVAEAIKKAKEDYRSELTTPREVITLPPRPPVWEQALHAVGRQLRDPVVLWPVLLISWFLLWSLIIGTPLAGLIAMSITAVVVFFFEKPGVVAILFASAVFLFLQIVDPG
jgi:hypothetical protein